MILYKTLHLGSMLDTVCIAASFDCEIFCERAKYRAKKADERCPTGFDVLLQPPCSKIIGNEKVVGALRTKVTQVKK